MSIEEIADLGTLIDVLENLSGALKLPLRPEMHVEQLRIALPALVKDMKAAFVHEFGTNPWE